FPPGYSIYEPKLSLSAKELILKLQECTYCFPLLPALCVCSLLLFLIRRLSPERTHFSYQCAQVPVAYMHLTSHKVYPILRIFDWWDRVRDPDIPVIWMQALRMCSCRSKLSLEQKEMELPYSVS